jgi:peptide/nickel transport system permease protein
MQRELVVKRSRVTTFHLLRRDKVALAGLFVLILLVVCAVVAPFIAPYDPIEIVMDEALSPPSWRHLMGTDNYGRDVLSRIIFGTRISLSVGVIATGIGASFGVLIGLIAGYSGGSIDAIAMRAIDFWLAFPGLILSMVVIAMLGPSIPNLMIAVGMRQIPSFARVVRGSVLSAKETMYVEAARSIGCSTSRIAFQHILPNVLASVIVLASLTTGGAIMAGAGLSFLGLGAQPPTPEWGIMLSYGRAYMRTAWWLTVFPGLAIMAAVLAINLLGDGLRVALDPRMRQR